MQKKLNIQPASKSKATLLEIIKFFTNKLLVEPKWIRLLALLFEIVKLVSLQFDESVIVIKSIIFMKKLKVHDKDDIKQTFKLTIVDENIC